MQVICQRDPLGGVKFTNRETGKSATIETQGEDIYIFDDRANCRGAWSRSAHGRALAWDQMRRLLS